MIKTSLLSVLPNSIKAVIEAAKIVAKNISCLSFGWSSDLVTAVESVDTDINKNIRVEEGFIFSGDKESITIKFRNNIDPVPYGRNCVVFWEEKKTMKITIDRSCDLDRAEEQYLPILKSPAKLSKKQIQKLEDEFDGKAAIKVLAKNRKPISLAKAKKILKIK